MTSNEIVGRTPQQELVQQLRGDAFTQQIAILTENPADARKVARVAATAILENGDLAKAAAANPDPFYAAVLKCAQDGLLPDGRQAALVVFGGKVQYMPMVGGFIKVAAEYGWDLVAEPVYENDDFDFQLQPVFVSHRPPRLGVDRGQLVGAYATAKHRDGRILVEVMDKPEIEKIRAKARSKAIWSEWTAQMYAKTPARKLFKRLPLGERESERIRRLLDENGASAAPIAALYGPSAPALPSGETEDGRTTHVPAGTAAEARPDDSPQDGLQQAEENVGTDGGEDGPQAASTPELSPDAEGAGGSGSQGEFDWSALDSTSEPAAVESRGAAAGDAEFPGGKYAGRKISDVAKTKDGQAVLLNVLRQMPSGDTFRMAVASYVRVALPDVWARFDDDAAADRAWDASERKAS